MRRPYHHQEPPELALKPALQSTSVLGVVPTSFVLLPKGSYCFGVKEFFVLASGVFFQAIDPLAARFDASEVWARAGNGSYVRTAAGQ